MIRRDEDVWWWTWAGARANATLAAQLAGIVDPSLSYDDYRIRLRKDLTRSEMASAVQSSSHSVLPHTSDEAVRGLKFSDVLPEKIARQTVALRIAAPDHACQVLSEARTWSSPDPTP